MHERFEGLKYPVVGQTCNSEFFSQQGMEYRWYKGNNDGLPAVAKIEFCVTSVKEVTRRLVSLHGGRDKGLGCTVLAQEEDDGCDECYATKCHTATDKAVLCLRGNGNASW